LQREEEYAVNILISADMEGISGVVSNNHTLADHKEFERFRALMTGDVNAAVDGALAAGATRIVVNDSHASMTNILVEKLHPSAELISGSPKPFSMMEGIEASVDAVFFIGYHASAGTSRAVLAHTWSGALLEVRLNDVSVGEIGLNAALAGAFDVPVVLVTGDQAAIAEASALLGTVETVAVKKAIGEVSAQCLHPDVVHERIRAAASRALASPSSQPFTLHPPIVLRVTFQRPVFADRAQLTPGSHRLDGRTLEWVGDDMRDVYQAFTAMARLAS
jgi:D-amino peptidase